MGRDARLSDRLQARFRAAAPAPAARNLAKTLAETAVFWAVFLLAVPLALARGESWLGLTPFSFPTQGVSPWVVFACAGGLGLWSGVTMAVRGRGTPLPLDCPRELVVAGPYRFVRNPMAMAGLLQGACVGLALGSPLTLLYVVLGGLVWHLLVRPIEERDLEARFGDAFRDYRAKVRCWLPRLRPLAPSETNPVDPAA